MIDIKLIRENPDMVKENIKKKFQDEKLPLVDEVIELDEKVRKLKLEGDNLRSERNSISSSIVIYPSPFSASCPLKKPIISKSSSYQHCGRDIWQRPVHLQYHRV